MSLIPRWIANWEMCTQLMGQTSDRKNNYRCSYEGPGNNQGYYDLGQNQFWDTVEVGCNYTATTGACGNSYGCIGVTGSPQGSVIGTTGQVYYDRSGFGCYISTGGTNWQVASDGSGGGASNSQLVLMASNHPGLPPLLVIDQQHSWNSCQQFVVAGMGTKRLPKRSEQVVAAAWSTSYSDTLISSIENGINLSTTGYCNSNNQSGVVPAADGNPLPANLETLPAILGSTWLPVRTGSISTKNVSQIMAFRI